MRSYQRQYRPEHEGLPPVYAGINVYDDSEWCQKVLDLVEGRTSLDAADPTDRLPAEYLREPLGAHGRRFKW